MPVIMVTQKFRAEQNGFGVGDTHCVASNYCRALEKAGATVIMSTAGDPEVYAEIAEGVLFTGGIDVNPARYGEENRHVTQWDDRLDQWEIDIFNAFYKKEKPILGICRGIQLINVAMGGTLVQDIESEVESTVHGTGCQPEHMVIAEQGSFVNSLFGNKFMTNSHHHQAVKKCGEGMRVTAAAADGVTEAIEHESLPIIGIQWHPERMIGEENFHLTDMIPLFRQFVVQCSQYENRRFESR